MATYNGIHSNQANIPKIKADEYLREFRLESGLSWENFNRVWMQVCSFVNAPSNGILFDGSNIREYKVQLRELADDIVQAGLFGPGARGSWVFGKHFNEPRQVEFTNYIGRITEYAIKTVKQQIPATGTVPSFQGDKVGQWLMNGHVEDWNRFGIEPCTVGRIITNSDDSTVIIPAGDDGSTTVADTIIYQGNEGPGGLRWEF